MVVVVEEEERVMVAAGVGQKKNMRDCAREGLIFQYKIFSQYGYSSTKYSGSVGIFQYKYSVSTCNNNFVAGREYLWYEFHRQRTQKPDSTELKNGDSLQHLQ
jgi:hypothetical protein